jgi:hypothetical protein
VESSRTVEFPKFHIFSVDIASNETPNTNLLILPALQIYSNQMDTLFQEVTHRTSSPWEGSGANTPALAAEVDDRGNVEYKARLSFERC